MVDSEDSDGGGRARAHTPTKRSKSVEKRHKKQLAKFKDRLNELGWRRSFVDAHTPDHVGNDLDEYRESEIIVEYTKLWVHQAMEKRQDDTDTDMLYMSGLSRKMATEMSDVIKPLYNTCYTRLQLLEIAIEYALEIYEKVLAPGKDYWVDTPSTDAWTPNATFKYVYNVSETLDQRDAINLFPGKHNSDMLFFHATNIRAGLNIVRHGVSHIKGRRCLDFGIQPSFYLTPDIGTAVKWCDKKRRLWQGESCILVYKIPQTYLQALNGKVFKSATAEWEELVTSSRRCEANTNALDFFDVVYGPMAANVQSIEKNKMFARPHKNTQVSISVKVYNKRRIL